MRPSPFTASGCSRRAAARYHGRCRGFVWGSTMTARAVTALPAVLLAALLVALLPAPPARGTGAAADFDLAKLNEGAYVVLLRHVTAQTGRASVGDKCVGIVVVGGRRIHK